MSDSNNLPTHNTHGAVVKLIGVILIILGALNTMLSWRGGFEVLSLPVILIAAGLMFCLIGWVLQQRVQLRCCQTDSNQSQFPPDS